jgi:secondary thiamine-phosphate synthase enzyme
MKIHDNSFAVPTSRRCEMLDITAQVAGIVNQSGITDGEVTVFCPHTTAAITINENADPDVVYDMTMTLNELFPQHRKGYRHAEGNSDAHIKSSLFGCSEKIMIKDGQMLLGTWQGIYFCEFDGPRSRKVLIRIQG